MNRGTKCFEVDGIKMLGNFNNGSIIGIDEQAYDYLFLNKAYDKAKKRILEDALTEMGFYDEKEVIDLFGTYLHVTDRCNLNCIGCYSYIENRNKQTDLTKEQIFSILEQLAELKLSTLVISGGEPFIRDDLAEILKYAKVKCKIPNIATITNGTLPYERYAGALPYIDVFNISVDGFDENTHYLRDRKVFGKIVGLLEKLPKGTNINLIATLHKKNAPYMEKYAELAKKYNVNYSFSIFTVEENNILFEDFVLNDRDLIQINENLKAIDLEAFIEDTPIGSCNLNCRYKCEAGNKMLSIDARGNVYPCHMLHYDELKIGDATKDGIKELLLSDKNEFKKLTVDKFNDCKGCEYKYLCGGGCRGRSYLKTGSFYNKDSYCALNYNFYKDVLIHLKDTVNANE